VILAAAWRRWDYWPVLGRWRAEREWPLARTRPTEYFLHEGGGLSTEAPTGAGLAGFDFDPARPVPTIGGSIVGFYEMVPVLEGIEPWFANYIPWRVRMRNIIPAGPFDQREQEGFVGARPPYPRLSARPDVLVFETAVLDEAVEVTPSAVRMRKVVLAKVERLKAVRQARK